MTIRTSSLALAASAVLTLFASSVSAQPGATPPGSVPPSDPYGGNSYGNGYYGPPMGPPPAPPVDRYGWNFGGSLGFGSLDSANGEIDCVGCDTTPVTVGFDLHVGIMVNPRLAVLGEAWVQARSMDSQGEAVLNQTMVLLVAQYWLTPRLWIKGGLGAANLGASYSGRFGNGNEDFDTGGAFMAGIGYELVHTPTFGFDLQLKTGAGNYKKIDDTMSVGTIGLGVNWY